MKQIELTQGQFAFVSDIDYEWLSEYKWHLIRCRKILYAARENGRGKIYMHRQILGVKDRNILVDHKDRCGLNNQRHNIRLANRFQNGANKTHDSGGTSKYHGVSWYEPYKKWRVRVRNMGTDTFVGYFKNEIDAALAYNNAALIIHPEFASINKI